MDHFETVRVTKSGEHLDVSLTVSPVKDSTGRIVGASKIARDITRQKRSERELRAAKEAAEAANQAKDRLLSVVSHELRTPLNPILATASLLIARPDLPDDLREDLLTIRRNAEQEARLIEDLLTSTRLGQGKVELHPEAVDALALLRAVVEEFRGPARAKGTEISLSPGAGAHFVWADPGRFRQMVTNLVDNAVKFGGENGRVSVRTSDAGERLRIEVADTGPGIDPELMPRLFDPFEQGEKSSSRTWGGLGLGLSIARSLAQLHGGTLTASGDGPGKGATFVLELPAVPAEAEPQPAPGRPRPGPPGRRAGASCSWKTTPTRSGSCRACSRASASPSRPPRPFARRWTWPAPRSSTCWSATSACRTGRAWTSCGR